MKIKVLSVFILLSTFLVTSCEPDDNIVDENPEPTGECMEFIDMHTQVKDARHIFFLNANEGWMVSLESHGAILLHTTDGGNNWKIINNDLGFGVFMYVNGSDFKFQFTDSNHGYLSIDFGITGTEDHQYYYTNDKGVTWDAVPLPNLETDESIDETFGMGVNNSQMVFLAYITNSNIDIESCYRLYFVSNDSHTITNVVNISCDYDSYHFRSMDIHFTESGTINLSAYTLEPYLYYMAHSNNYGVSWTYTEVDYLPGPHSYMEFPTDNVGYMAAENQEYSESQPFYKTTDGGATWVEKSIDAQNGIYFNHFAFSDANNGLAVRFLGSGGLYKTTNGGETWDRISCFLEEDYNFDNLTSPKSIAYPSTDNGIILSKWMDVDAEEDIDIYQNRVYFYTGE